MPLLDRNGWKAEAFDVVAYEDLDAALAAKLPGQKLGVLVSNDIHPRELAAVQEEFDRLQERKLPKAEADARYVELSARKRALIERLETLKG